ncbi:PAS domain-containing protein [Tellurirhabdus rosea]|uniref:PAS domain-containing protein n=1 Tax=Tellurirhabdus rosea TaxID=2674997 RepID=UPI002253C456|nr:PAS domain-containing protein [Tellurirhabdus rosea]
MSPEQSPPVSFAYDPAKIREMEQELVKLRRNDLQYRTLLVSMPAGVLLEDENRGIIQVNQLFCNLFGMPQQPDELIGIDCSQSAEYSKHLFREPETFVRRIEEILHRRELVTGESLDMADGRILERDYIPLFLDGYYLGHLWRYTDVTEQRRLLEKLKSVQ